MVLFASIAGLFQIFIICPRWRFLSYDGTTNRSLIPIVITALILALVTSMYLFFPGIATDLVSLVPLPLYGYMFVICMIAVMLAVQIWILRHNVLKAVISRFETYYMNKLAEEYSKGDVVEETSTDLKKMLKK